MKRHEIKSPKTPSNPTQLRQEVDTCIRHITQVIETDPKKAAKIFETWLGQSAKADSKKRAA